MPPRFIINYYVFIFSDAYVRSILCTVVTVRSTDTVHELEIPPLSALAKEYLLRKYAGKLERKRMNPSPCYTHYHVGT
jgi:hypothetical protein